MVTIDVTLLPVFLLAIVQTNPSDWTYGPEVIYDARIDGNIPSLDGTGNLYIYNTTTKLKCRPKNLTMVSCFLYQPRIIISLLEPDGTHRRLNDSKQIQTPYPANVDHSFEYNVDLDRSDVNDTYIASSSITASRLDVIRSLMDTLYLKKIPQNKLEIIENSTMGTMCRTTYRSTPIKLGDGLNPLNEKRAWNIIIKPNTTFANGQGIEIHKSRAASSCTAGIVLNPYEDGTEIITKSWKNRMTITKNDFTCCAESEAILTKSDPKDSTVNAIETITLRLEDIVPAREPLRNIPARMPFGRGGTRVFHSFSAAEYLLGANPYERHEERIATQ